MLCDIARLVPRYRVSAETPAAKLHGLPRTVVCHDDGWLGLDVDLKIDRPSCLWTFPIETVSQSEAGFELVHQSVVVQPHWFVEADGEGRWSVQIRLSIGTAAADIRRRATEKIGVGV